MLYELNVMDEPPAAVSDEAADEAAAMRRLAALEARLRELLQEGLVVAFSGGVDSAFLLWACERVRRGLPEASAARLVALTTSSASMPATDREDARRFAASLGVEHVWRTSTEVSDEAYRRNDRDRCYHCKAELFRIAFDLARERGCRHVLYGYNDSDRSDVRPGHRAALERGVRAPLAEAGLTKADIRALMRRHGLDLADKPASPCLSSRIQTGIPITPELLADVEAMETILRRAGLRTFRVRISGEDAGRFVRLEVVPDEMARALEAREALVGEAKRRGYRWVTLDLEGYRTGGGTV